MVEIEGMIKSQLISILIDPSASLSYISPRIVDLCNLVPGKFVSHGWYSQPQVLNVKSLVTLKYVKY